MPVKISGALTIDIKMQMAESHHEIYQDAHQDPSEGFM